MVVVGKAWDYGAILLLASIPVIVGFVSLAGTLADLVRPRLPSQAIVRWGLGVLYVGALIALLLLPAEVVERYERRYGPCVPGATFERNEYTARVYVNMFRADSDGKDYRVPTQIHAGLVDNSWESFDGEHTYGGGGTWRIYELQYADLPNGGRIVFDEEDRPRLKLGKRVVATDVNGSIWEIELTDQSAKD